MRIRLLGTAAGGGFPQWNCRCALCDAARNGAATPRTQSSVVVGADGERWFLLNASPDVRSQIEAFPPLRPPAGAVRGSPIEGVLLTNGDLDHVLGLFILREGSRLTIHATEAVREALSAGLRMDAVLNAYCGVEWRIVPRNDAPLRYSDGTESGLRYAAIPLDGKPPRYRESSTGPTPGDSIGYIIADSRTGRKLAFLPDVAALEPDTLNAISTADVLLLDGTFWSDDEMIKSGAGDQTAERMFHLPIGGSEGSLARIAPLPIPRKVYVHINNTNPILNESSEERRAVHDAGVEIGYDGLDL